MLASVSCSAQTHLDALHMETFDLLLCHHPENLSIL